MIPVPQANLHVLGEHDRITAGGRPVRRAVHAGPRVASRELLRRAERHRLGRRHSGTAVHVQSVHAAADPAARHRSRGVAREPREDPRVEAGDRVHHALRRRTAASANISITSRPAFAMSPRWPSARSTATRPTRRSTNSSRRMCSRTSGAPAMEHERRAARVRRPAGIQLARAGSLLEEKRVRSA